MSKLFQAVAVLLWVALMAVGGAVINLAFWLDGRFREKP